VDADVEVDVDVDVTVVMKVIALGPDFYNSACYLCHGRCEGGCDPSLGRAARPGRCHSIDRHSLTVNAARSYTRCCIGSRVRCRDDLLSTFRRDVTAAPAACMRRGHNQCDGCPPTLCIPQLRGVSELFALVAARC
jgi:hypothetical protein